MAHFPPWLSSSEFGCRILELFAKAMPDSIGLTTVTPSSTTQLAGGVVSPLMREGSCASCRFSLGENPVLVSSRTSDGGIEDVMPYL